MINFCNLYKEITWKGAELLVWIVGVVLDQNQLFAVEDCSLAVAARRNVWDLGI